MLILILLIGLSMQSAAVHAIAAEPPATSGQQPRTTSGRQLLAVRGEIIRIATAGKGLLSISVKPSRDFEMVTILARENDQVGSAVSHENDVDLLDLLTDDDPGADERITAAELQKGDSVSVIYDPSLQNRALEIYLH